MQEVFNDIEFDSPAFQRDPYTIYAYLCSINPIFWSRRNSCYFLLSYELVSKALTDDRFSVFHPLRASRIAFGPSILDTDGIDHINLRRLTSNWFQPTAIKSFYPDIEKITDEVLKQLPLSGKIDFMKQFVEKIPVRVMAKFLGLPIEFADTVYERTKVLMTFIEEAPTGFSKTLKNKEELEALIANVINDEDNLSDDSLLRHLVRLNKQENALNTVQLMSYILLLLSAGTETTVAAIGNILVCLLENPTVLCQLQKDSTLIPRIVRESLRFQPPVHFIPRFAIADIEIGETLIPHGSVINLCLASTNRDPLLYDNPNSWNPKRVEKPILSFSMGSHHCLGYSLAQQELEVVLKVLLSRLIDISFIDGYKLNFLGRTFRRPDHLWLQYHLHENL
jgi:cytochrome P450